MDREKPSPRTSTLFGNSCLISVQKQERHEPLAVCATTARSVDSREFIGMSLREEARVIAWCQCRGKRRDSAGRIEEWNADVWSFEVASVVVCAGLEPGDNWRGDIMQARRSVCAVLLLISTTVFGQERGINVRTSGTQSNAAVAARSQGYVVTWNSYYSSTGRSYDILARLLDPNGEPMGSEFQVNPSVEGNQNGPAVAADGSGGFAIAWQGPGADQEDVYVRLYDPNGQPRSDAVTVNEDPNGRQLRSRIAMRASGDFVVVWENRISDGTNDMDSIRGRWFDASGRAMGPTLRLDEGMGDARYPDVATDGLGNIAVTWMQDRTSKAVFARLLDSNGVPRTTAFEVSSWSFSSVTGPSIAMSRVGDFVIVWDGDPNRAGDDGVLGRCYDPNGRPRSEPFRISTVRDGAAQWPQAAMNDANEIVVVWQHETQDANTATDIFSRRFDGSGNALAEPVQLNTYTAGHQRYPDVALTPDGDFAAVWESEGQDGSGYGIRACVVR
jgi:hypothetical protein